MRKVVRSELFGDSEKVSHAGAIKDSRRGNFFQLLPKIIIPYVHSD